MTFQDAFAYANQHLAGQMVCICNLDIFLDSENTDWQIASRLADSRIVLCLSRWEWDGNGGAHRDPAGMAYFGMADAQDAWIFRSPLTVPDCDFEIGMLGCDNAIAERFCRAGMTPVNAPNKFRIFHIDKIREKSFANQFDVHKQEAANRPKNQHPERRGQWLIPDIDHFKTLDELATALKLNDLQKYVAICDLLNKHNRISNPD
jgi:hypothetical protein